LDALKRGNAASITVALSYLAYARQDRMDKPGTPISAKLIANLLTCAGASQMVILDLHSDQIEVFFDIPVRHLLSRSILIPSFAKMDLENVVIVAPDKGSIKIASDYAKQLNLPIALINKERIDAFNVETQHFVGNVKGCTVLIPDDMCSTGSTLIHAAAACAYLGAERVIAAVGHGLFIGSALESIHKSPIEMVFTTNSIDLSEKLTAYPNIKVLSIAPLFAEGLITIIYQKIRCRFLRFLPLRISALLWYWEGEGLRGLPM
jgi:ribose-phosphate pyrophosphokinase